ncbi:MAG: glycosyltransferase family 2 protein [Bacteroidia bacterium]
MPEFSIITINYNNRAGLQKTLESVWSQKASDFEYIIIDGGSTDGSRELIQENASRFTAWVAEPDQGIYHAMNKGLALASGTYCLFLNSGDSLASSDVMQQVRAQNASEQILYGEVYFEYPDGSRKLAGIPEKLSMEYLFGDNIWHPSTFILRELLKEMGGYNQSYAIAADYEFFFHALAINQVSSKRLAFPVSIHVADGLSSRPENLEKIREERDRIHRQYLSPGMIESLTKLVVLQRSGAVRMGNWLDRRPILKTIVSRIFKSRK